MRTSTQTYLYIDATIGRLIAFVFDCIARLFNTIRGRSRKMPEAPACILVTKFMGIGSIVQALPFFEGLRKCYPNAKILLLTFKDNEVFTKLINIIDKVYYIDKTTPPKLAVTTCEAVIKIRKEKPVISIDLEVYSRFSRIVSFLIFAPYRMGFFLINTLSSRGIFTHLLYFNRFQHISRVYKNMAYLAGVSEKYSYDMAQYNNFIKLLPESESEAVSLIRNLGIKDERIVFVNMNASDLCIERRWPAESFQAFIRELLKTKDVAIILIGSQQEWDYNQKCLDQIHDTDCRKVYNIAGKISFGGFLDLLRKGSLLLTNDSGPMHLGAFMNCPTVSLWGPGTPQSYAPQNANHIAIYHSVYCSPCLYMLNESLCKGNNICMRSITPEEVFKTCLEILDNKEMK